ncbi:MAG: phosphatase PAP2 family protein [Candidatus Kapabacteria bacterium]|nr:phosphatase PAP2 family protein [Ignavibacteriota bacterium]MCW5884722.1 phosphatase PAP2 family protein [Candidatus Kapabacteria bacterium]
MPEFIQNIDTAIFYWINNGWSNSLLDKIMPFVTTVDSWILIYLLGFYVLFFKTGKIGKITGITLILTIIISDQISSSVLKEYFGRIRPCHTLPDVNLLVGCGGGKSFPSSHAVNNFASATVTTYFFKKNYMLFYSIAAIVAISRVYVGVHFPLDITAGAIIGTLIGFGVAIGINYFITRFNYSHFFKKE